MVPYEANDGCAGEQSPNGNDADPALDSVSHEHIEMITDPYGSAWFDNTSDGNEIADKCPVYGAPLGVTPTGEYNQTINTHPYWLQEEWSNRAGGCVQRNTFPQPNISFSYRPATSRHGRKTFLANVHETGESQFTYRWTFQDGTVSTEPSPTHVFRPGPAKVTLIVSDVHGDQTEVTENLRFT